MRVEQQPVYIHVVWATWQRLPLLTEQIERAVYRAIAAECERYKVELIAIGGMCDHVHLLV